MPSSYEMHECNGPVIETISENGVMYSKSKCVTCNEVWISSTCNTAAVRKINLNVELEMSDTRHPAVIEIMKFFKYEHLPPNLQEVSKPICELAEEVSYSLKGPELTVGLRKLLEAKDCFVRAAL